jgi:hypothetical protein
VETDEEDLYGSSRRSSDDMRINTLTHALDIQQRGRGLDGRCRAHEKAS